MQELCCFHTLFHYFIGQYLLNHNGTLWHAFYLSLILPVRNRLFVLFVKLHLLVPCLHPLCPNMLGIRILRSQMLIRWERLWACQHIAWSPWWYRMSTWTYCQYNLFSFCADRGINLNTISAAANQWFDYFFDDSWYLHGLFLQCNSCTDSVASNNTVKQIDPKKHW